MIGLVKAPEIDRKGFVWFNVGTPLSLDDLEGRLVILEFSTFCGDECDSTVEILEKIERSFPGEVVIIGVHSPRRAVECDADVLAQALDRRGIRHPVIHDPDLLLWEDYCIQAGPTLVLVAPDGAVVGALQGPPHAGMLMQGLRSMLREWRHEGLVRSKPDAGKTMAGAFRFPGRVKPMGRQWVVADTGHHQIALLDDQGREKARFGTGKARLFDGPAESCAFNAPQGLACDGSYIYVADTGNHAIRRIDVAAGEVVTLAGNGNIGSALREAWSPEVALNAPWDLEVIEDEDETRRLVFANSGSNQIGAVGLGDLRVKILAGSGQSGIVDGPGRQACLARPSALALDARNRLIFFADCETASIRALHLDAPHLVQTLVGTGLWEVAPDQGGFTDLSMLQPLGLAWSQGMLVVTDSLNGEVRLLDLCSERAEHFDGVEAPPTDGLATLPTLDDRPLLVADTNNHRVVEIDLSTRQARRWAD